MRQPKAKLRLRASQLRLAEKMVADPKFQATSKVDLVEKI
jgi:hypothetical protein